MTNNSTVLSECRLCATHFNPFECKKVVAIHGEKVAIAIAWKSPRLLLQKNGILVG
jgi:hypothetical protein